MSAFTTEEKALIRRQAAEDRRRREAILSDRSTMPMDFSPLPSSELPSTSSHPDPLWKRVWRTEGIRWLGPRNDGVIDAMERFEHAFMLGYKHGVTDMRDAIQGGEA